MFSEEVIIEDEVGLHARPASILVSEASKFESDIHLIKNYKKYNAKSMIEVLRMAGLKGEKIVIQAEGKDEENAVREIVDLIIFKPSFTPEEDI